MDYGDRGVGETAELAAVERQSAEHGQYLWCSGKISFAVCTINASFSPGYCENTRQRSAGRNTDLLSDRMDQPEPDIASSLLDASVEE